MLKNFQPTVFDQLINKNYHFIIKAGYVERGDVPDADLIDEAVKRPTFLKPQAPRRFLESQSEKDNSQSNQKSLSQQTSK